MANKRIHGDASIDCARPLTFTFNGRRYEGYAGDTLASALLANDVRVLARSFKVHRPRGLFGSGLEEPNALVTVGDGGHRDVNLRATEIPLREGLVARSQNCWPSVDWDIGAVLGWFAPLLPAGFYHKTFKWPGWRWYEWAIRRTAGLGSLSRADDVERYAKRFHHCDVLIVGGGPAGLAAALSAAAQGIDVTVLDSGAELGGSLLWERTTIDGRPSRAWAGDAARRLSGMDNVRLLPCTTALGYYDDNLLSAVERLDDVRGASSAVEPAPGQRLWKIRATRVILATGALERPLVFTDNDRPGIMLAGAMRMYANRYGACSGRRVALFTNNDSAYAAALDLHAHGVPVVALIDARRAPSSALIAQAQAAGIAVHFGHAVVDTRGRNAIRSLRFAELDADAKAFVPGSERRLECDLLGISGGWNPTVHLYSQAGGKLRYDVAAACFVPDRCAQNVACIGAANGSFGLDRCLADGDRAGNPAGTVPEPGATGAASAPIEPLWRVPCREDRDLGHRQWVDLAHDVTVADIDLAAREGFVSVEHLKRYTATGTAVDQGKTSNVNALALLGAASSRAIADVGTTTFRPPYHPVTIGALAGNRVGGLAQRYRCLPVHWHEANGAGMEDHSGWLRPAYYLKAGETEAPAIEREVRAARNAVALFDSSSLGKIEVHGPDAAEFLNRLYVNNVRTLQPGRLRYGMMLNDNGIIIDDGVFGCLAENHYVVNTSSAGARNIHFWMEEWLQCEWRHLRVRLAQQTAQWATLTVSGPKARAVVSDLHLGIDLSPAAFPHMHLRVGALDDEPVRVRRASFTGEISFELDIAADRAESLWLRLLEHGATHGITPLGMEALDILRVEKGFLEVGADTDGETTPLDVGWGAAIARKPEDFIGRRSLARPTMQHDDRLQLVGLIARTVRVRIPVGTHVVGGTRGEVEGHVTSSCFSPHLNQSVALARVRRGAARKGESLRLDIGGVEQPATITDPCFFDVKGERLHA